jgi:hypothetical protein
MRGGWRDRLERELLLTKGGGIYYDAARVAPSGTEATLFVGLGGTGSDMLIRVKNEVKRRMVLPKDGNGAITANSPPNIGFLAFDTDEKTKQKTWGIASFDQFGSELCSLCVNNLPAVIENVNQQAKGGNPVWSWFDGIRAQGGTDGANGIRQIGRLMLFQNISSVSQAINQKMQNIIEGHNKINIFLMASIAGGTGAGTFLDMAYILRQEAGNLAIPNVGIFGYLVLPDVNLLLGGDTDQFMSNAFASLKELDYWMRVDEHNERYVCQYPNGTMNLNVPARPFDFCHLLSAQNLNGVHLTYNQVITNMAENAFSYIAGEVAAANNAAGNSALTQNYNNVNTYTNRISAGAPIPACYRYLAVGSSKLEIPYEEISTLISIRLFQQLQGTLNLTPDGDTYEKDMESLTLLPRQIVHDSLLDGVPRPKLESHRPVYRNGDIWSRENTGPRDNRAYNDAHRWLARDFQVKVSENAANFPDQKAQRFKQFAVSGIRAQDRGPCYIARLLSGVDAQISILHVLDEMAEHCRGVQATEDGKRKALLDDLSRTYDEGARAIIGRIFTGKYRRAYLKALKAWQDNDVAIYVYGMRAQAIQKVHDVLNGYYDNIFSPLCDVLETMPDILQTNLDHITNRHNNAIRDNMLDKDMLVWPLDYEMDNKALFDNMVNAACGGFLGSMSLNLKQWVGRDFDTVDSGAQADSSDIPGFISDFIGNQFSSLLAINMQGIINGKLQPGENFNGYVHAKLLDMVKDAVPMFSIRAQYAADVANAAANMTLCSIPHDCLNVHNVATTHIGGINNTIKLSNETTRIMISKIIAGIPLYAYEKIEDMERRYTKKGKGDSRRGTHLIPKWLDAYPSPLPEAAWSSGYADDRTQSRNRRLRELFDMCVKNEAIVPNSPAAPTHALLRIADGNFNLSTLNLTGSTQEKIYQLKLIRSMLWREDTCTIQLEAMGKLDDNHIMDNIRENALRFPAICDAIEAQGRLISDYTETLHRVSDPMLFAVALYCGLIVKVGIRILLRKSVDSPLNDTLYETANPTSLDAYNAYQTFHKLLNDDKREYMENLHKNNLQSALTGSVDVKDQMLAEIGRILELYPNGLRDAQRLLGNAEPNERGIYEDIVYFYQTVIDECKIAQEILKG